MNIKNSQTFFYCHFQKYSTFNRLLNPVSKLTQSTPKLTKYKLLWDSSSNQNTSFNNSTLSTSSSAINVLSFRFSDLGKTIKFHLSSYTDLLPQYCILTSKLIYHPFYFFKPHLYFSAFFIKKLNNTFWLKQHTSNESFLLNTPTSTFSFTPSTNNISSFAKNEPRSTLDMFTVFSLNYTFKYINSGSFSSLTFYHTLSLYYWSKNYLVRQGCYNLNDHLIRIKDMRVRLQKSVRRESKNSYVPRFFSYTIDKNHNSADRIKDVPDYITLKESFSLIKFNFGNFLTTLNKPQNSFFWINDVYKYHQADSNYSRVTTYIPNLTLDSSVKSSKITYFLFYQTLRLNLLYTESLSSNQVFSNSFYSNSFYKNSQNAIFSLKRLNFDEKYFPYIRSKNEKFITLKQRSKFKLLKKLSSSKVRAFGKKFYISNVNLYSTHVFRTNKNSVHSNKKRNPSRLLKFYRPVLNRVSTANYWRSYRYNQQFTSFFTQNKFFKELSFSSKTSNSNLLRQFLILSKNRKSVIQNPDLYPLLMKSKPVKFLDPERQFYWDIRRDSVRTLRYLQKRYVKSSKSLFKWSKYEMRSDLNFNFLPSNFFLQNLRSKKIYIKLRSLVIFKNSRTVRSFVFKSLLWIFTSKFTKSRSSSRLLKLINQLLTLEKSRLFTTLNYLRSGKSKLNQFRLRFLGLKNLKTKKDLTKSLALASSRFLLLHRTHKKVYKSQFSVFDAFPFRVTTRNVSSRTLYINQYILQMKGQKPSDEKLYSTTRVKVRPINLSPLSLSNIFRSTVKTRKLPQPLTLSKTLLTLTDLNKKYKSDSKELLKKRLNNSTRSTTNKSVNVSRISSRWTSLNFKIKDSFKRKQVLEKSKSKRLNTLFTKVLSNKWVHSKKSSKINSFKNYEFQVVRYLNLFESSCTLHSPSFLINRGNNVSQTNTPLFTDQKALTAGYSSWITSPKLLGDIFFWKKTLNNPLLTKYLVSKRLSNLSLTTNLVSGFSIIQELAAFTCGDKISRYVHTNLHPSVTLKATLSKRVYFRLRSESAKVNVIYTKYKILTEFIEKYSGRKSSIRLNPTIEHSLTFEDVAQCLTWRPRIYGFQRLVGPRIFVVEALDLVCVSLRLKDPTFLANWIRAMLKRLNFWKHRVIFRYVRYLIRYLFMQYFAELGMRGIKIQLKGKISVAGNARTRTLFFAYGETSQSKFDHKVAYDLSFVETFTGIMGFKVWFFY